MGQRGEGVLIWGTTAGSIMIMQRQVGHVWGKEKTTPLDFQVASHLNFCETCCYCSHSKQIIEQSPLTATEVSKDIVALFREGDLIDGVSDVPSLQQIAGIFTSFTAICESFHMMEEPVHHIRTWSTCFRNQIVSLQLRWSYLRFFWRLYIYLMVIS